MVDSALEECREHPDVVAIIVARLLDVVAHRHVLDHALAQRADGLRVHRGAPHLEVDNPPIFGSPRSAHTSSALAIQPPPLPIWRSREAGSFMGGERTFGTA